MIKGTKEESWRVECRLKDWKWYGIGPEVEGKLVGIKRDVQK